MIQKFETIYKENQARVYRICLGYVNGNAEMAKDLTQEVFIKIWKHLKDFRSESKISTWIYRIAVNTCLMELRKKKYVDIESVSEMETESSSVGEIEKESRFTKMYDCIYKLKKEDRTLILLDLEEVPQKEIAEILGISHEAIRVRIHRIKKSLTKCVQHGNI